MWTLHKPDLKQDVSFELNSYRTSNFIVCHSNFGTIATAASSSKRGEKRQAHTLTHIHTQTSTILPHQVTYSHGFTHDCSRYITRHAHKRRDKRELVRGAHILRELCKQAQPYRYPARPTAAPSTVQCGFDSTPSSTGIRTQTHLLSTTRIPQPVTNLPNSKERKKDMKGNLPRTMWCENNVWRSSFRLESGGDLENLRFGKEKVGLCGRRRVGNWKTVSGRTCESCCYWHVENPPRYAGRTHAGSFTGNTHTHTHYTLYFFYKKRRERLALEAYEPRSLQSGRRSRRNLHAKNTNFDNSEVLPIS